MLIFVSPEDDRYFIPSQIRARDSGAQKCRVRSGDRGVCGVFLRTSISLGSAPVGEKSERSFR